MDQPNNNDSPAVGKSYLFIALGSSPTLSVAMSHALLREAGVDPDLLVKYLLCDYLPHLDPNLDTVLGMSTADFFGPESFVAAVVPADKEALANAEHRGLLWPVGRHWHSDPGASAENTGACADPSIGFTLTLLNQRALFMRMLRMFQQLASHANRDKQVLEGMEDAGVPGRSDVHVLMSPHGGTGAGAIHGFLGPGGIRACAKQAGVTPNIILSVVCRGNLPTPDTERADLNQFTTFQYLRATGSRAYVSPLTGEIVAPCDRLFVFSNQNAHGDLLSYEQLLLEHGHSHHFLQHTLAGAKVRQRLVDLPPVEFDQDGDPKIVHTMGLAYIGWDKTRVVDYHSQKASAVYYRTLLAEGEAARVREQAAALAHQHGIVESDRENQITAALMTPSELGENVTTRLRASLLDRVGNARGLDRAEFIQELLQSIVGSDLPAIYAPVMSNSAQNRFDRTADALERYLDQVLRTDQGLWEARVCFGFLKAIASQSAQETIAKANELEEYLQPHEEILATAAEQQDELQHKGRIARLLHYPLVRRLVSSVEQSALAVLDYRVQITACHVALEHFLTPLADYLDRKLAWLAAASHKLLQAAQIAESKAETIGNAPTTARIPIGIELVDRTYLERGFAEQLAKENGPEGLATHIRQLFLQKYETLAWLMEAPLEELQEAVTGIGNEIFRPVVEGTDVLRELARLYPDENNRKKVFERPIQASEGLLPVTGEVNQPVVWLKAATVPSAEYLTPMKELLETIDGKPGKYEMAVSGDPTQFTVFQLRGGISLTPYIRRVELPDNEEGWRKAIAAAADPVSAILVGPRPTLRQFRRVLGKAVASGQLSIDEHGGYQIACPNGEILPLGKDFRSVERKLRHNWPHLVFVESTFGRNLVVAEEQTTRELHTLLAELQSGRPTTDPRFNLFDLTAVQECLKQAELLLPRLRRITEALQKGVLS
jgi:hypothetical protein